MQIAWATAVKRWRNWPVPGLQSSVQECYFDVVTTSGPLYILSTDIQAKTAQACQWSYLVIDDLRDCSIDRDLTRGFQ